MKKLSLITLSLTALVFSGFVFAGANMEPSKPVEQAMPQANDPFARAHQKLKQMTPEERHAFMEKARAKWESLSSDEKQKFKLHMREKMDLMKKQEAERKMVKIYSLYLLEEQP